MSVVSKNTMVGASLGTVCVIVAFVWMGLGLGRPLFAADLTAIQAAISVLDDKTAIAFLEQQKSSLQTEIRSLRRELRANPDDVDLEEDIASVEDDITEIDGKITCVRTTGCSI